MGWTNALDRKSKSTYLQLFQKTLSNLLLLFLDAASDQVTCESIWTVMLADQGLPNLDTLTLPRALGTFPGTFRVKKCTKLFIYTFNL